MKLHLATVLRLAMLALLLCVNPGAKARDLRVGTPSPLDRRVLSVRHQSAALGIEKEFNIYVPEEAEDSERRFPALYLFRGHEREWIDKTEDGSRGGTNVIDVYLDLRRTGAIEPMILVFPGITDASGAVHSTGVNMRAPGSAASLGTGRFDDYVIQDLIPYVDANFPTIASAEARGADGFSLGGFASVGLALRHPGTFKSVGAFDGLYFLSKKSAPTTIASTDQAFRASLFDQAFGSPRDKAFAAANNPLTILPTAESATVGSIVWLIEFGPKAAEPNVNFVRGKKLVAAIVAKGGVNLLRGAVAGSAHTWRNADEHMRRSLPHHSQAISAGP